MAYAVIMAGGRGERLWPLSTPEKPKQFLKLGPTGKTLLQETVARISPLIPKGQIYVITPKEYRGIVLEQLDLPEENVIVEPIGRSTGPCVGLAAAILGGKDPPGVMIVLPADHVIKQPAGLLKILRGAVEVAKTEDFLITLGIVPDRPATGYGYIHRGRPFESEHPGDLEVYEVRSFTEKPDRKTAERFLKEGGYYWNSGMFVWRTDVILAEIEHHMPKLYEGLVEIRAHLGRQDLNEVIARVYEAQESISIDFGVLERSSRVLVIPAQIGWSDVGDWAALDAIFDKDEEGNVIQAEWLGIDTKDSIIYRDGRDKGKPIATIGIKDLVIVETEEGLLIMDKARAQEVREITKRIGS